MDQSTIQIELKENGVAVWTLNHPPSNTIHDELLEDLQKCIEDVSSRPEVRVIVMRSAHPKIFLAGMDIKMMVSKGSEQINRPGSIAASSRRLQQVLKELEQLPKPVIAAISGHALGGGCELALACDFRIMSAGSIGLTEISLGLIPGGGGTQRLVRLLGRAKATELIFLGRRLSAEEAAAYGLVTKTVSPETFNVEVMTFADRLAKGAIQAMGLAKACLLAAEDREGNGYTLESEAFEQTFTTGEPMEGLAAFFSKRPANFIACSDRYRLHS
ncbi:enoyl-CoA hydratase/isomerase family protein [Alicyclobacillus tolerans]|uniref:Enoyl-CoA hydratase/carnithine racemase n=1 Tax=Alicyclobacillus tolerans TaxID=90970 RepID=A0ABT9LZ38_9BACL|nr:enoyl-CoA hydratase/isomerase family protein [Alicyclobacillus tengchongensis]MDP9729536.1 enoyl-CoA hydratase/carnithine racemase [Alicyclobacillus tengchongensis]